MSSITGISIISDLNQIVTNPDLDFGDVNLSAFLWAMTTLGINVYFKKDIGFCNFSTIVNSKCEYDKERCQCCVDYSNPYLIIDDLHEFFELMRQLHIAITHSDRINWLKKNSVVGVFNNATYFDLEHPTLFLSRLLEVINNAKFLTPYKLQVGKIMFARGVYELEARIEESAASQECPNEFIPNLIPEGDSLSSENELHRVRFGIVDSETAIVTSVQTQQLELSQANIHAELSKLHQSLYVMIDSISDPSFIPETLLDLLTAINSLRTQDSIDYWDDSIINLLFETFTYLSTIGICCAECERLKSLLPIINSYKKRSANSRVLNPEMRMNKSGYLSCENSSCFSLMLFIGFVKQLGISKIRFPISFPFRDLKRSEETVEYIIRKKALLVERLRLELGLGEDQIKFVDDGCSYLIDISKISIERPFLRDIYSKLNNF